MSHMRRTPIHRLPNLRLVGSILALTCAAHAAEPPQNNKPAIYVEDSPAAIDLLQQAAGLRQEGRLTDAVARYQSATEQYGQKLTAQDEQSFSDVRLKVDQTLRGDAELLEAYVQVHEPTARRMLENAGAGLHADRAALQQIQSRYALTPAALEAGLRLAAVLIERAHLAQASAVLDDLRAHPSWKSQARHWHTLRATAAMLQQEDATFSREITALGELGDAAGAGELQQARGRINPPVQPASLWAVDSLPAAALPSPAWPPLWEVTLPTPARQGAVAVNEWPAGRAGMGADSVPGNESRPWPTVLPVARGDVIYLNDGESLLAIDRSSGRQLWSHRAAEPQQGIDMEARFGRVSIPMTDARGALVTSQRVVGVLGVTSEWRVRLNNSDSRSTLVGLDAEDGKLAWQLKPAQIDPLLATAFFHGTPVTDASESQAFVLLRRSQVSGFADSFLVAVDLREGKPLWRRHLVSAASANSMPSRGLARLIVDGMQLFVADPAGTVCNIDARDGAIRWLTILPQARLNDGDADSRMARMGMTSIDPQTSVPVRLEAGLVIPPLRAGWPAMVMNPQTGKVLREIPIGSWAGRNNLPPLLTAAHGGLLVVRGSITLLDGKTLEPRWDVPLPAPGRSGLHGRPAVTESDLLLPLADRVLVMDMKTGAQRMEIAGTKPGNVLVLEDQVVVATNTTVHGCMTWELAYKRLNQQIAQMPDDPRPALALAHVAMAAKKPEAVLEGADAAILAEGRRTSRIESSERSTGRNEVFSQLIGLAENRGLATSARQALFDQLAQSTRGPEDQVIYHLSLGQFLIETNRIEEAVDQLQTILAQPTLASSAFRGPSGSKQAGLESLVRLRQIVRERGPSAYQKYDQIAAQRLRDMTTQPQGADPAALSELARQFPLAEIAPLAMTMAGEIFARRNSPQAAIQQFRLAYRAANSPEAFGRIVGRAVELHENQQQPQLARQWLLRLQRDHPAVQPLRNNRQVPIESWLKDLSAIPGGGAGLPRLELPWSNVSILSSATLLVPASQPQATWPRDRAVTLSGDRVQMRRGPGLSMVWERSLGRPGVKLLWQTDEQVLLWIPEKASLHALDAVSGQSVWTTADGRALLDEVGPAQQRARGRNPEQRRFLELVNNAPILVRGGRVEMVGDDGRAEPLISVTESTICMADAAGRVVGIDRGTGQVRWRELAPMDRIDRLVMDDDSVVLAGVDGVRTDSQSETMLILDTLTGERRSPVIEEEDPIQWIGLGGESLLIHASATQVTARRTARGEVVWRTALPVGSVVGTGVVGQEFALIQASGSLLTLDLARGQVVRQFAGLPVDATLDALRLQPAETQWHLMGNSILAALGDDGRLLWRDALPEAGKFLIAQAFSDRYVVVLSAVSREERLREGMVRPAPLPDPGRAAPPVRPRRFNVRDAQAARVAEVEPPEAPLGYRLMTFDRLSGALVDDRSLGVVPEAIDPNRITVLDHRLLLGTRTSTIVIPVSTPVPGSSAAPPASPKPAKP